MTDGSTTPARARRRGWPALAALVLAGALVLVPAGGAVGRYTDPTGDGNGAPDITNFSVDSDAAGQITFTIGVVDLPSPADVRTFLFLDTDANPNSGSPDTLGADYLFVVDESDNSYGFARWNGSAWDENTPFATVRVRSSRTNVTISVNRSELGNASAVNFWVRTRLGAEGPQFDDAPNDGTWNYTVAARGPTIQSVRVVTTPARGPTAGRRFVVQVNGVRVPGAVPEFARPQSFRCSARIAGRAIRGTGTGGCTFQIPRNARRKQLVLALTVTHQGTTTSFRATYRVS